MSDPYDGFFIRVRSVKCFLSIFLCILFTNDVLFRRYVAFISTPIIGVKSCDSKWLKQCLQTDQHVIFAITHDIHQHLPARVVNRMP